MSAVVHRPAWDLRCSACPCWVRFAAGVFSAAELAARGWYVADVVRCPDCDREDPTPVSIDPADEVIEGCALECAQGWDDNRGPAAMAFAELDDFDYLGAEFLRDIGREPTEEERARFREARARIVREQHDAMVRAERPWSQHGEFAELRGMVL